MLRAMREVKNYKLDAVDEEIGSVRDLLFDDETWTIRYVVANTGPWLFGRKVLIPWTALSEPDWGKRRFPVSLTKQQIKDSPDIDTDPPVSRKFEQELYLRYGWQPYWGPGGTGVPPAGGSMPHVAPDATREPVETRENAGEEVTLRSLFEVIGYRIAATDDDIGHIDDLIAETDDWVIRYWVVDTRNWLPGRRVLVVPEWVEALNWQDREAKMNVTRKTIEASPPYDPHAPINRSYETVLYDYYGRTPHWRNQTLV